MTATAPRYHTGWWIAADAQTGERRFEAYVAPANEDWFDIYRAPTWWSAMAMAIRLAADLPDCAYVGGPSR